VRGIADDVAAPNDDDVDRMRVEMARRWAVRGIPSLRLALDELMSHDNRRRFMLSEEQPLHELARRHA